MHRLKHILGGKNGKNWSILGTGYRDHGKRVLALWLRQQVRVEETHTSAERLGIPILIRIPSQTTF